MKRSISSLLVMFLIVINFTGCAAATEQGGTLDTTAADRAAQATDTTGATGTTGATEETRIVMRIGDPVMTVNGAEAEIDKTTPRLIQSHTLKNAVNPPFSGRFFNFRHCGGMGIAVIQPKLIGFSMVLCNDRKAIVTE